MANAPGGPTIVDRSNDNKASNNSRMELDDATIDAIRSGISLWACPTCRAVSPSAETLNRCTGPQRHLRPLNLASFNLCSPSCTDRVEKGGTPLDCPKCRELTEIMKDVCPDAYREPVSTPCEMLAVTTGDGGSASATLSEGKMEVNAKAGTGGMAIAHISGFTGESACIKVKGGDKPNSASVQIGDINVKGAAKVVCSGSVTMQNIRAESSSVIAGDMPQWMLKMLRGE
jgi:hypothetical protein